MLQKPFHTFYLPIFFVLHVANSYYGLIPISIIFLCLAAYLTLSLLLLLTGKLIFRQLLKASLWSTSLLIIFFFFGSAHDFLKKLHLPALIVSYSLLLPCLAVMILIISLAINRSKQSLINTTKYLNILFFIFVFLEVSLLVYKFSTNQEQENNLLNNNKPVLADLKVNSGQNPDIFFIIFDEYASSLSLEKHFHYNNNKLDSTLKTNNFFISSHSGSNYNSTPFSIGSTLNLDYFNRPLYLQKTITKVRMQAAQSINNSELPMYLHKNGYQILNFGLFDLKDSPSKFSGFSTNSFILPFYGETLWGRIKRDILWNSIKIFGSKNIHRDDEKVFQENMKNFDLSVSELNTQSNTPKFVLCHLLMPHSPYVIDSTGKRINFNYQKATIDSSINAYINQLAYTNKLIAIVSEAANKKFTRPRIVIIEGDHGFRDLKISDSLGHENHFMNLNSYYFSDRNYDLLYDSISPVNSFRVILNKYFRTDLPLLKDSSILLD